MFNEIRVRKVNLGTYTAQARRSGSVSFGTTSVRAIKRGRYWYVQRDALEQAVSFYQESQANPGLRRVWVDQMEFQGWVTVME